MKIATLGPKGTFSHQATLSYNPKSEIIFKKTIWDIFNSVENEDAEVGIVPIENSIGGTVGLTLDGLIEFDLNIIAETIIPVSHNLVSLGSIKDITTIYAHPQTYAQCIKFIRRNFKNSEITQTISNGESAEKLIRKKDKTKAAIVSKIAAEIYNIKILKKDIQDNKHNTTRFIIISKSKAKKTGNDKTSIVIYPQVDKPGLLHSLLGIFSEREINLNKIESRPTKSKLGDYFFFIDHKGHVDDAKVKEALEIVKKEFHLKILGSYPKGY
ncbi:MAG: prephenate dehydratase [Candidatus Woesearchaeota archaeon]|jgi:prephenate dehydratase|nr:prephenate dehydratase [Candidatus Woesearchaeota archaeon]